MTPPRAGRVRRTGLVAAVAVAALVAAGCGSAKGSASKASSAGSLKGLFRVAPGACGAQAATGSYFRMVQPGGSVAAGPYVTNGDSACADKTWTILQPGADGGLRTATYQAQPDPPFDGSGNAMANHITQPAKWFAVTFALASNQKDPQTGTGVPAPSISVDNGALTGDLSALAASWNGQHFNQGAPKPGGARPGGTVGPKGTYDAATKHYTLDWSSQIAGGPFNNFVGIWHLEGTFEPSSA